jgi:hypothetical protein
MALHRGPPTAGGRGGEVKPRKGPGGVCSSPTAFKSFAFFPSPTAPRVESHIQLALKSCRQEVAAAAGIRQVHKGLAALYLKFCICGHGGFRCQMGCVNN